MKICIRIFLVGLSMSMMSCMNVAETIVSGSDLETDVSLSNRGDEPVVFRSVIDEDTGGTCLGKEWPTVGVDPSTEARAAAKARCRNGWEYYVNIDQRAPFKVLSQTVNAPGFYEIKIGDTVEFSINEIARYKIEVFEKNIVDTNWDISFIRPKNPQIFKGYLVEHEGEQTLMMFVNKGITIDSSWILSDHSIVPKVEEDLEINDSVKNMFESSVESAVNNESLESSKDQIDEETEQDRFRRKLLVNEVYESLYERYYVSEKTEIVCEQMGCDIYR